MTTILQPLEKLEPQNPFLIEKRIIDLQLNVEELRRELQTQRYLCNSVLDLFMEKVSKEEEKNSEENNDSDEDDKKEEEKPVIKKSKPKPSKKNEKKPQNKKSK